MKLTLLELVGDMLSAIDAEQVMGIGETEEAGMCVNIANRAYEAMIVQHRWRHLKGFSRLTTSTYLNEMVPPAGTIAVDFENIWYANSMVYYVEPEIFVSMTKDRTGSNVVASNTINIYTDRNPVYFTSDDDYTFRFDAIPNAVDGLASADTRILAWIGPTSRLSTDGAYFDLPYQAYPALNDLCLAMAVGELKGDSEKARDLKKDYVKKMGSLARNARLIDKPTDLRKQIVARRTRKTLMTPTIATA